MSSLTLLLSVKITTYKAHILQNKGKVLRLYISTGRPETPRKEVETLEVDRNGVKGDKFYAKDPNRAILVSSQQSYAIARHNDININEGVLGENIYIDIDPYSLLPGDIIEIGKCRFEVTQNCTLCKGLSQIDSKLPKLLKDDRGIFVRALGEGTISLGESVSLHRKKVSQ